MSQSITANTIPTVKLGEVFHVGTLNIDDRKKISYEGEGLSISVHPNEWSYIARLTGETRKSVREGVFVDFHALTAAQRAEALAYAYEKNYVANTGVYEISWFDDEWGTTFTSTFDTKDEAQQEAEEVEATVYFVEKPSATTLFPDMTVREGDTDVDEKIVIIWVNETLPQFDGVWWEDKLDVNRLSAPRGVISVSKLDEWIPTFKIV